ncbi:hypothetical protein ACK8OR_05830 [Jannaschia sp. KMU-145]|uniref:hypothetical protein n=1 Tax=Jannaschia halovivens TaxID=3388667 RepID=UPI00396B0A4F
MRILTALLLTAGPAFASPMAPPPLLPGLPIIGPAAPSSLACDAAVTCERAA